MTRSPSFSRESIEAEFHKRFWRWILVTSINRTRSLDTNSISSAFLDKGYDHEENERFRMPEIPKISTGFPWDSEPKESDDYSLVLTAPVCSRVSQRFFLFPHPLSGCIPGVSLSIKDLLDHSIFLDRYVVMN